MLHLHHACFTLVDTHHHLLLLHPAACIPRCLLLLVPHTV
jgi:hypothetical protein